MSESQKENMISVIIPVYNAQGCLERCILSILNNSYRNIEIICVNDGSTDNSLDKLNELSRTDNRIKIYSQTNGGVSSARNTGITKANGKYICFIDSDDFVDSNYFSDFISEFEKNDIQLCINGYKEINLENNQTKNIVYKQEILSKVETIKNIFYDSNGSLWNKMFLKEIIEEYCILFDESISYCEDMVFLLQYITKINKASIIATSTYNYFFTSIDEKYDKNKLKTRLIAIDSMISEIQPYKQLNKLTNKLKAEYIIRQNSFNNTNIKNFKNHPTYLISLLNSENYFKFKILHIFKYIFKFSL